MGKLRDLSCARLPEALTVPLVTSVGRYPFPVYTVPALSGPRATARLLGRQPPSHRVLRWGTPHCGPGNLTTGL